MVWLPLARRSFLSQLGTGATTVFGAALVGTATLEAQSTGSDRQQPTRHAQDDWLDQLKGQHRLLLDATTADGFGQAVLYARNFLVASETGYKLKDADSAIVIVARHFATVFAYNDAMWAKYGPGLSQIIKFADPQTKEPAKLNIYNSAAHVAAGPSVGNTVDSVLNRGVHLAVCQMATRFFAQGLAGTTGGNADAIFNELAGNLVGKERSHMVPAGIVAVNRAQERGYTFAAVL
jgi:hypothetical protein